MSVETINLRPDHTISRVVRGAWQLAGDHGPVDRAQAIRDMEAFVEAGIFTFDCADIYTGVEEMIGEFISDVRARRGAAFADRVCVHTKLVPDLTRLADLRADEVEAIVDRSLKRLQVDQLDLVQFFWWDLSLGDAVASLDVLKSLKQKGKIKTLGTTNWDRQAMQRFVDAGFDIASAQVQFSVLDRRPQNGLTDWAARNDVQLICYGTLAGGFLTEKWIGVPDPGFEFENRSLIKYRLIIDEFGPWDRFQALLEALSKVGGKYGVSLSAVATRWVLDQRQVAAGIVGARYAGHLPQTLQTFAFQLDAEDHATLNAVLDVAEGPRGDVYSLEGDRSSRHGRIMKYNLNANPNDAVHGAHG